MHEILEQEYRTWSAIYNQASSAVNGRGDALDKAAEIIEKDMFLLGASAIEDRLQDGVPKTIHTLQQNQGKYSQIVEVLTAGTSVVGLDFDRGLAGNCH